MTDEDPIKRLLDALDRLMRMFAIERILYLICAFLAFIMLGVCLVRLMLTQTLSIPELSMVFGASGLIAASAARVSFFLNKAFDLVSDIVRHLAGIKN